MARIAINLPDNSHRPPNTGDGTEFGDNFQAAMSGLNAMTTELYNRTGGTASTTNPLPSGWGNFRNAIDGGDFTVNPWQRGTSFTGFAGATVTYTADRFFVFGQSANVSAKAAQVAFSSIAGMSQAFRFGRQSTASSLSAIVAGQVLETNDSIRFQGQTTVLSFWALAEANFSGANLQSAVVQGTGTDQSAASAIAGTWTSQTTAFSNNTALTSSMTRYAFSGTVSNNTSQVAVLLNYTPVGSAGAADSVLIQGVQLEVNPSGLPSDFEHRDVEVELALCQRYCFVLNEPASGIGLSLAAATATNKFTMTLPLPTPMRAAPTLTITQGSFGFQVNGAYAAGNTLAALVGHTAVGINLTMTAAVASNFCAAWVGGGGVGKIVASADY